MEDKKLFIDLLKNIDRKGIDKLIVFLEDSDFFRAPASIKYHNCFEGGLLKHSLNVYFNLKKLNTYDRDDDTLKIVALLHDICKVNLYKFVAKGNKYEVNDILPLGHGEKSVILIQKFINLTEEEILAIRWHMGGFEPKENYLYLNKAFNKCDLAVLLHIADLKATYLDEKKGGIENV